MSSSTAPLLNKFEFTDSVTLESPMEKNAIVKTIILRVHTVEPAKDTKKSRVSSAILGNDNGTTVRVEAWRGNADRLVASLKPHEVYRITSLKVKHYGEKDVHFNETSSSYKLNFDSSSLAIKLQP